jgi:HK97 family phage major capsid protein
MDKLLADLKATDERLDALLAGDDFTDEQRAEHDKLVADRAKLVERIDRDKARAARDEQRQALEADAAAAKAKTEERERRTLAAAPGRLTDPDRPSRHDVPAERRQAEQGGRTEVIPASVKRFGNLKNFRTVRNGMDAETRAYRFGMWALARLSHDLPNRYQFKSAMDWWQKQATAVITNDGSGYNFLIPEEFGADIIDLRERYGVARRLFKMVPMASDTRTDPRRKSGLTAYFVAEGQPATESNKVWTSVRLTAKDLACLARYTNQINADAVIAVGDDLAGEISYAFTKKEDDCAFNGDGTSTYGGIVGCRVKLTNCDGSGTASKGLLTGSGGSWSGLTLADFQKLVGTLPQYADTAEACWVAHRAFYYGVMQVLELAAGGVTALEIQKGDRRQRPLFLGYPVEFSQIFPSATAGGTVFCTMGDHTLAAEFGDRQQDSISFSEHATIGGENVFERNEIAIRGVERIDINVHDAGDASVYGPIVGLKTS